MSRFDFAEIIIAVVAINASPPPSHSLLSYRRR